MGEEFFFEDAVAITGSWTHVPCLIVLIIYYTNNIYNLADENPIGSPRRETG
jgi:hypothetical protein